MQTRALLLDSFRMMVARKLFWVTLAISTLVVIAYGSIGSNSEGLTLFFGAIKFDVPMLADHSQAYRALIQLIFANFLVPIWLAWIATILALVSTTSIFPDFQAQGAIDIVLSKPITRWKIFLVKYAGSMIFVFLQVGIFCLGVFLVVGLRLGEWNRTILLGIPIVLVFFSYLYSFNALIGVVTKSAIAALLFTMLFWFMLFVVQVAEAGLGQFLTQQEIRLEWSQQRIDRLESRLDKTENPSSFAEALSTSLNDTAGIRVRLEEEQSDSEDLRRTVATLGRWHKLVNGLLVVLPKNQQTIGLLDRWIRAGTNTTLDQIFEPQTVGGKGKQFDPEDIDSTVENAPEDFDSNFERQQQLQIEAGKKQREKYDAQSPWFIIGTSLGFEAVLILLAGWIFTRRDY